MIEQASCGGKAGWRVQRCGVYEQSERVQGSSDAYEAEEGRELAIEQLAAAFILELSGVVGTRG